MPGKCRTVLVLGAGASSHLGFPLGPELCAKIISNTGNRESEAFKSLLDMRFDAEAIVSFHHCLKNFLPRTIDQFLAERPEFRSVGKAAIAQVIIAQEDENKLLRPDANWYFLLADRIRSAIDRNVFPPFIVTFNYDLSLDKCLYGFLKITKRHQNIKTLNEAISVLHVHGSLGQIDDEKGPWFRSYGKNLSPEEIMEASQGIRVPDELDNDYGRVMVGAQRAIEEAERVIFLGFGYDEMNLNRLAITNWKPSKFHGTAFNFDRQARQQLLARTSKTLSLGVSKFAIYEYLQRTNCWNY